MEENKNTSTEQEIPDSAEALNNETPVETTSTEENNENIEIEGGEGNVQKLKTELSKLKKQKADLDDKFLRLVAEFQNYRNRTGKEKMDLMKTAAQDTLSALLPVLDDFDRAKKNADDDNTEEVFSEGVNLVYQKLYAALKNKGLKPMDSNGLPFDPEQHEAVTEIPAPTDDLKGKVVDTIEKGYFLNDKIIRYAKVVVGK